MKITALLPVFFIATLLLSGATDSGSRITAVTGARIMTAASRTLESGTVLIRDGLILAVGADLELPADALVIDARGGVLTPGLIDAHSHAGLGSSYAETEDNEATDPLTPQLRIIDSIHPEGFAPDRGQFRAALAEGVTTLVARPGSANVIGGQSAVLKTVGRTVDEMLVLFPADMKMALGRKSNYAAKGLMPMTRMGAAALVRQAMLEALEYGKKSAGRVPDLKKEALLKVVRGELPVHVHVESAADISTALRLAREFGFKRLSLAHAEEAYKLAADLAREETVVVVGPRMIVYDEADRQINLADYLVRAGVQVCIMTDADVVQQNLLRFQAGLAVKYGMDPDQALRAITINPALLMGLADRLGSIEPGKEADLVIFDGDPFCLQSRVLQVLVAGRTVYRADSEAEK